VFLSVDPLAFKMPSWTPYHYTFNNPISFVDPNGMEPQVYVDGIKMGGSMGRFYGNMALEGLNNAVDQSRDITYAHYTTMSMGEYSETHFLGLSTNKNASFGALIDNPLYKQNRIQGDGGTPDWVNNTIGAAGTTIGFFQVGYLNDANQKFKYAQRINGKVRSASTITRANRISSLSTAKSLSRVGGGVTFLAAGATVYDGLTGNIGWQNHHTADLLVTGLIYGTAAAFPVVGWIVGGLYFATDLTTKYYTGKSITQNLFDQ
ncbi:MAG: hypothetical protein ACXITV_09730, partial [Luteibaculaceae bacterium]